VLTKKWTDWVDYWAVDFDYESRKEIIKVPKGTGVDGELPGSSSRPTGRPSSNSRNAGPAPTSSRTNGRASAPARPRPRTHLRHAHLPKPGRYTIAVKVIDIFGNDTMTLVPVRRLSL
jgi:hypothetical protein